MKTLMTILSTALLTLTAVLAYLHNVTGVDVSLVPVQGYVGAATTTWIVVMIWATGYVTRVAVAAEEAAK